MEMVLTLDVGVGRKHKHTRNYTLALYCIWQIRWFNSLIEQVGEGHQDHGYWGRPENMNMDRPAYSVNTGCHGSDVAGDTVAAMASGYLVFKTICGGMD